MRRLWEWRWLVAWLLVEVTIIVIAGPSSPAGELYLGLSGVSLLYLWARWMRPFGPLAWEVQDAFDSYSQLGEQLAEVVAAPGGLERQQRVVALTAERRATEEKLDGLLARWPHSTGLAGRVFPSWGRSVDRALDTILRDRQRAARTYDLLTAAITSTEVHASSAQG